MAQADIPAVRPRLSGAHIAVQSLVGRRDREPARVHRGPGPGHRRRISPAPAGPGSVTDLSAVVGYIDIHAVPNHARRPTTGATTRGATPCSGPAGGTGSTTGSGSPRGDFATEQISEPMGRDVIRAIDHPIVEKAGGQHWGKIPSAALVAGLHRARRPRRVPDRDAGEGRGHQRHDRRAAPAGRLPAVRAAKRGGRGLRARSSTAGGSRWASAATCSTRRRSSTTGARGASGTSARRPARRRRLAQGGDAPGRRRDRDPCLVRLAVALPREPARRRRRPEEAAAGPLTPPPNTAAGKGYVEDVRRARSLAAT